MHSRRRIWWAAGLALLLLPLGVLADRALGSWAAGPGGLDLGEARWVWAPRVSSWSGPTNFLALRDLELSTAPASARMLVLADEEYLLFVNGDLAGTGRYRGGRRPDSYDIAPLLRPGNNRLAVELRSSRGVGGFLADLQLEGADGGTRRLVSDAGWSIATRFSPRLLLWNEEPLPPLPPALELGPPPFARWGPRGSPRQRVLLGPQFAGVRERQRSWHVAADGSRQRVPARRTLRGQRLLLDFGDVLTGYLVLAPAAEETEAALVYVGEEVPEPERERPANLWAAAPGRSHWIDSEPRRFRYVTLLGSPGIRTAQVYVLREQAEEAWPPQPAGQVRGVFGLDPARLRTTAEDEIWRRLEGPALD